MAANMLEEDEAVTALPSSYANFGKFMLYYFDFRLDAKYLRYRLPMRCTLPGRVERIVQTWRRCNQI